VCAGCICPEQKPDLPGRGTELYAIVRTGGKQYRVAEKTVLAVEKLDVADGETIELTDVLMIADGDSVRVGTPTVAGAKVTATVVETFKGRKIHGYTYKPTKGVQRHYGHRQWHTRLRIDKIEA
jgi:large subunit ribosomal protein L21